MMKALIRWRLGVLERRVGEPVEYLRYMLKVSLGAFRAFVQAAKASAYRKQVPGAPFAVARIVAVRHEDCGPCLQTVVNLAKQEGVPAEVLQAAIDRRPGDLPPSLTDVYRFAEAVVTQTGEDGEYRERVRKVFGDEGLVELALAIATCRLFPTLKRGLGYATSCSLVQIQV